MALAMQNETVSIEVDGTRMEGMLWLPNDCFAVIVFAHAGKSSRVKLPNDYVASVLHHARLGTMWLDLTPFKAMRGRSTPADIDTLQKLLGAACVWLRGHHPTSGLPLGLYAAEESVAAALQLAAKDSGICAVVSRGGRPELAGASVLGKVAAPTLLIVGGLDEKAVAMNRSAYAALRCKKQFEIITGATHAFDEPGSPEMVARLARGWFLRHANLARV